MLVREPGRIFVLRAGRWQECIYTGIQWGMGAKYEPRVSTQTPSISLTSGDESAQRATSEADTRGLSWYEGLVLPPSRIRGPGIDITTFAKYAQKFQSKSIFCQKSLSLPRKCQDHFKISTMFIIFIWNQVIDIETVTYFPIRHS